MNYYKVHLLVSRLAVLRVSYAVASHYISQEPMGQVLLSRFQWTMKMKLGDVEITKEGALKLSTWKDQDLNPTVNGKKSTTLAWTKW